MIITSILLTPSSASMNVYSALSRQHCEDNSETHNKIAESDSLKKFDISILVMAIVIPAKLSIFYRLYEDLYTKTMLYSRDSKRPLNWGKHSNPCRERTTHKRKRKGIEDTLSWNRPITLDFINLT